ncbi:MAG: sigma-70 family RNA polymerase sigma factor [Caldilineaceae bacterium]|nr:sigma-70 family RNA polymerase sigma factor [Caldilineaceae bacterium]HRW05068.1 sigma-70 family RNA polymerase sigma factor [Caldilineaceae bacterium]
MNKIQRDSPIDEAILVDLITRAQTTGDPLAFDGLYLYFADRVFRYLLSRVSDGELAEEMTAQVFLQLIEKIGLYRIAPKDNATIFAAWLYRLSHNKMIDILRKIRRNRHVAIEHAELVVEQYSVIDAVEDRMDFEQLLSTLQMLNEQQRQVILLRFLEGYSIAETAEILQKSEGAVKALQHRSLENLRHLLLGSA